MNNLMRIFILGFIALNLTAGASATSYYVADVKTSDANPELAKSLKSLVTSAVSNAGGQVSENESGADYSLRTELVKLGQSYVLSVSKIKKGEVAFASRQKAATVEDLDDAADRAVRAAIIATPAKKDTRVGEVKANQEDQLRRRILSRSSTYFGFGPAGFTNMGVTQLSYDVAIGHLWEVTPNAAIRVLANGVASADLKTYFMMAQLGLNYYFTDEDSAPYVSAGLGFGGSGSATSNATTIGGFAGTLGLGYEFFRTSSTQFDTFLGYSTIFGNNTIGAPGYFGLRIGVMF